MDGYNDDYEDFDDYEDEGEEQEEEETGEEEHVHQPTQEELEYLELRQRLKESFRKKMKKESSCALSNPRQKNRLPNDNFGSFFGPSQPMISQRVIQESKSFLENPHIIARVSRSNNEVNKISASRPLVSKSQVGGHPKKVTSGVKTKIQMLKNTRDYSFLLSEDAELPACKKDPPSPPRNVSVPNSEARTTQVPAKPKSQPSLINVRKIKHGHEVIKKAEHSKVGIQESTSASKPHLTLGSKKQRGASIANGPGWASDPKPLPLGPKAVVSKQNGTNNVNGLVRPSGPKPISSGSKPLPLKKPTANTERKISPNVHKPLPSKFQPSTLNQQKKESQGLSKRTVVQKRVLLSKHQAKHLPGKIADRPKKKPVRHYSDKEEDDYDEQDISSMIRGMFGYNPNKYGDDGDDRNMEAGFSDILKEERRSALIAKREDEEELRKIEEEERKERLRKRKLTQR